MITASLMSAVYLAGLSHDAKAVVQDIKATDAIATLSHGAESSNYILPAANAAGQRRYIIQFKQPSVARYDGNGEMAAIPRLANHKIDVKSSAVRAYVNTLEAQQASFLSELSSQFGRSVSAIQTYQFAVNGMALYLSSDEVALISNRSDVKHLELDREYFLDTDAGPTLIGANNVWEGNAPSTGTAFGEGVVLGIIDSGANFDHPSFADVGGDGYDHTNPLGAGTFLGACDPTNTEQFDADYTCNDKLIGGYDFVDDVVPVDGTDVPGPEDENGHGTHTASTAGGNMVLTASANGVDNIEISGVARHANIVVYDACYTSADGRGLCPFVSTLASIDQIVADGVVDVVNYSIGGGGSPWTEALSQSFLAATDNGVFVSASAGNSGPGPATLGHLQPWTSTVGASTHNRRFSNDLNVTGPDPVPIELTGVLAIQGSGPAMVADMTGTMQYSENIDATNVEGCAAFPASSFDGLIAVISRGACSFADKVNNASAAGATGVIVHNNAAGEPIVMGALEATTIPSVMISLSDGMALVAHINANPGTGTVAVSAMTSTNSLGLADSMAGFSSRGPSPFEVNKPDVTAPGVSILAAFADSEVIPTSADEEYGIISGTSMSSPHNAGAAALLKELQPTWSVPEIKSALMMTSVTAGVTKEDGMTPADPFDRGAGRIQVDLASSTGLVLDETAFDFLLADPANGGDPKELNLASYKNDNCEADCVFERTFRSVSSAPKTYDATVTGLTGVVSPANFTVMPGQQVTLEVTIDGSASPIGETSFGELLITATDAQISTTIEPNVAIPDNTFTGGSLDGMVCETISVSGVSSSSFTATLEVGINHTWIGDLTVKLVNPNGDILTTLNTPQGGSTDFDSAFPITFIDGALASAEGMGSALFGDQAVCRDDAVCEYAPSPDSEPAPPSTLAELGVGSANGDWMVCVGDSAVGDIGDLVSATLNIQELDNNPPPELHLPLVIIGFPDQPIIGTTPASINEELSSGESADVTVNINNSGLVADLNWNILDTGSADNFTLNQPAAPGPQQLTGILNAFGGGGIYPADSFNVTEGSVIENVSISGVSNGGGNLLDDASEVTVTIYADAGGVPAGHPEDGLDSDVFSLTLPVGDPSLDLDGGSGFVGVDILAANGVGLELPAGQYWVLVYPTVLNNNIFFWTQGEDVSPGNVFRIDPNGLLGGATDWEELTDVAALNVTLSNELTCGAPWLSASLTSDATGPGADVDVTVSLDSTGLAEGTYRAAVCIENDDFDNSLISIPVTMIVGPSDLIFANGFEAAAP